MSLNRIDASWVDDATKASWRAEWSAAIDAVLAAVES